MTRWAYFRYVLLLGDQNDGIAPGVQAVEEGNHHLIAGLKSAGAGRGSRTPKGRSPADFESAASASSAIPADSTNLLASESLT